MKFSFLMGLLLITSSALAANHSGCDPTTPGKVKAEYLKFFENFKAAVGKNDKEKLKDMMLYPVKANVGGKSLVIASSDDFLAKYNDLFTAHMKKDIESKKISKLSCTYNGVMVGNGEMWLQEDDAGKVGLALLNNYE